MTNVSYRPGEGAAFAPHIDARQQLNSILRHAVLRDLERLATVLADPVTAVRRAALIGHVTFLADQLRRHWRLQDELIWPRAVARDPELAGPADEVRRDHQAADSACADVLAAARTWDRAADADHRLLVRAAVTEFASVLPSVFGQEAMTSTFAFAALTSDDRAAIERGAVRRARPTTLARELFWLLDELDHAQASVLLARIRPLRVWVLRNGFSGGYNRGSYLMWVGGGLGAQV